MLSERNEIIKNLKSISPKIWDLVFSETGYEFSGITALGHIQAEPGMLISTRKNSQLKKLLIGDEVTKADLAQFLTGISQTPYEEFTIEELADILERAEEG